MCAVQLFWRYITEQERRRNSEKSLTIPARCSASPLALWLISVLPARTRCRARPSKPTLATKISSRSGKTRTATSPSLKKLTPNMQRCSKSVTAQAGAKDEWERNLRLDLFPLGNKYCDRRCIVLLVGLLRSPPKQPAHFVRLKHSADLIADRGCDEIEKFFSMLTMSDTSNSLEALIGDRTFIRVSLYGAQMRFRYSHPRDMEARRVATTCYESRIATTSHNVEDKRVRASAFPAFYQPLSAQTCRANSLCM